MREGGSWPCWLVQPDLTKLVPCSHVGADTRLLLHVGEAVNMEGYMKLWVDTVAIDVPLQPTPAANERKTNERGWLWLGSHSLSSS